MYISTNVLSFVLQYVQWSHNLHQEVHYLDSGDSVTVCVYRPACMGIRGTVQMQILTMCIHYAVLGQCDSTAVENKSPFSKLRTPSSSLYSTAMDVTLYSVQFVASQPSSVETVIENHYQQTAVEGSIENNMVAINLIL